MRAVVQRVTRASVTVDDEVVGKIGPGVLVLLGVGTRDTDAEAISLADRVIDLRIFPDEDGKMDLSLADTGGDMLVVSQFTLFGDARRGRRPSYISAAAPAEADRLYEAFTAQARTRITKVSTGRFRAMMQVELVNDGPVTILLDTEKLF